MSTQDKQAQESLRPVSMYEITAKLFTHVTKSITERFGQVGETYLQEGVRLFSSNLQSDLFSYEALFDSTEIEHTYEKLSAERAKAGLEPLTIYGIMAKLFAHVSKAIVDHYGEAGREVMMEGVRTFGEERGRDIARRAAVVGEPNKMNHYLSNYDMGRSELFEYETLFHPTEIEQTFTKCAFAEQWKKDGMGEYGILYCHMIDPAIARGFNPNFEVVHDQYILKEGVCHFRFQMKDENANQMVDKAIISSNK